MNKSTILFLDLEETIIDDWWNRIILNNNLERIKDFIKNRNDLNITNLGLFSFAVNNEVDFNIFQTELKNTIETELGLSFKMEHCLTVETIVNMFTKVSHVFISNSVEFNEFCGDKAITFFRVIPQLLNKINNTAVLIDDTVSNMTLLNEDNKFILETININRLIK